MQILFLTQVLPHPTDSGPKVRARLVIEALARHHDVTLVSFVRGNQDSDTDALRRICRDVHTVSLERSRPADIAYLARSVATRDPFTILRDDRAEMRELVDRVAAGRRFDAVHADQINMAQYAERVPDALRVLDAHNALWLLYQRLSRILPLGPRALALAREWRLMRSYERRRVRSFDAVMAVSELDRAALTNAAERESVAIVPIAIAPDDYAAAPRAGQRILHLGTMHWPPNADAVRWFCEEILPLVRAHLPRTGFDAVGPRPPGEVARLARADESVRVPGFVDDLAPWIDAAGVFVVPLRAGAGMRVKILEAMARGLPVVTTRVGCEGIEVRDGHDVLIADQPEEFAAAVVRVLRDRTLAAGLGENGRKLVRDRYDAATVYGEVTRLYAGLEAAAQSVQR